MISVGWVCLTQALVFLAWVALFSVCGWFDVGLISFKWFGFIIELRLPGSLWCRWVLLLDCEFAGGWYFGWCCDVCFICSGCHGWVWICLDLLRWVLLWCVVGVVYAWFVLWWLYWRWCLFMLFGDCCFACFGCLDVVVLGIVVVCVVLVCMVDLLFVGCLVVCLFCLVWLVVLGVAVCCRFGSSSCCFVVAEVVGVYLLRAVIAKCLWYWYCLILIGFMSHVG